jgi:hypothetical protein
VLNGKTCELARVKASKPRPTLTLDVEKYQHLLDAPDMSEDQKKELLEALWLFVVSFVDLGFDMQSAEDTCGKAQKSATLTRISLFPSLRPVS